MFLQKKDAEEEDSENWRFFPQDFREKNDLGCHHREAIEHVFHFEQGEKYFTSGRDGTFRIWNSTDLKHIKTVSPYFTPLSTSLNADHVQSDSLD